MQVTYMGYNPDKSHIKEHVWCAYWIMLVRAHVHSHTVILTAIFPGELGSAGCLLDFPFHLLPDWACAQYRLQLFIHDTVPQVLPGQSLCLVPSTSDVIQHFITITSTCPNYLKLSFLITKLTHSSPISWPLCIFSFLSINKKLSWCWQQARRV